MKESENFEISEKVRPHTRLNPGPFVHETSALSTELRGQLPQFVFGTLTVLTICHSMVASAEGYLHQTVTFPPIISYGRNL